MAQSRRISIAFVACSLLAALVVSAPIVSPADAQTSAVVINEFQASNQNTLADNTGSFEDWIELRNTTGATVNLAGWTLSDQAESFTFSSAVSIGPNGFLVVFASGSPSRSTPTQTHLPFKLSAAGEPLTLTEPGGALSLPAWEAPLSYPQQLTDDSYGIASGGQILYFTDPTPGSANNAGVGGLVAPVAFSVAHGFYTTSQTVVLDTSTPSATIRYTTNGDVPTTTTGTAISPGQSITVSSTTTIRAVAYRSGWITSPVETRTYLFAADIVTQSSARPAGWPNTDGPNGQQFNYGMDPNVVGSEDVVGSLLAIPSISIVTDLDNLFDPVTGIYVNASERSDLWERQASIELIDPTGGEAGFDIEAGIRIRGGFSRSDDNPKHSLRLFFRDSYESELDYPLFGAEGVDTFSKVDLRTSQNFSWSWRRTTEATFVDELFSRDTQRDMGHPYTRTRPYHLYINGQYWGLYQTQERVSGDYGASYLGGDEDDFDVIKRGAPGSEVEASDGSLAAFQSLWPLVSKPIIGVGGNPPAPLTDAEFDQIAADVDLVNLADYYLIHFFTGDYDGAPSWFFRTNSISWNRSNNYYAIRNRNGVGLAGKWQFFDHDSEHSLCANEGPKLRENIDNTTPWNMHLFAGPEYMSPGWIHAALISHPGYRQIFADRVQLHMLTPGGALTYDENIARYDARVAEFSPAIEAESARWGDAQGEPEYGRDQWNYGLGLERQCFADRESIVEAQLRADGLWPAGDAPSISPAAGAVPYGTNVTVDASGGSTTWVTTDGSDPRATDGTPSGMAFAYTGPIAVLGDITVKARILTASTWTPLSEAVYTLSSPPGPVRLALNEFNAVSAGNYLGGGTIADIANGTDETLGRIDNNGGDWFELVVIEDHLDIRGWTFQVWNLDNALLTVNATLTLGSADILSDLRAGTLVTISEDIADDISYNPVLGDWHINLRANGSLGGAYVTAASQTQFGINNSDTQIAIFDAGGIPVALRTGEGTVPGVGVSSTEVFKLEGTPTSSLTPDSPLYSDGTSSTWGLPNRYGAGSSVQDLSPLRISFGDVNCDGLSSLIDALLIAQYSVGTRTDSGGCPLADPVAEIHVEAGDVNANGITSLADALLIAQCAVGQTNQFCP